MEQLLNSFEFVQSFFRYTRCFDFVELSKVNKRLMTLVNEHINSLTLCDQNVFKLKKINAFDKIKSCILDDKLSYLGILDFGVQVCVKMTNYFSPKFHLIVQSLEFPSITKVFPLGFNYRSLNSKKFELWNVVRIPPHYCLDGQKKFVLVSNVKNDVALINISDIANPSFTIFFDVVPFSLTFLKWGKKHLSLNQNICTSRNFYISLFAPSVISPNWKNHIICDYGDGIWFDKHKYNDVPFLRVEMNIFNVVLFPLNNYLVTISSWGDVYVISLDNAKNFMNIDCMIFNQSIDSRFYAIIALDDNRFIAFDPDQESADKILIVDVLSKKAHFYYTVDYRFDSICLVDNAKIKINNYHTKENYLLDFSLK